MGANVPKWAAATCVILTKRAYIYERNTNTAFDTRTESKSVNGVDVIFALE